MDGKAVLTRRVSVLIALPRTTFRQLGRSAVAALVLSLFAAAFAQQGATAAVDTAVASFQQEGTRLVGVIGAAGFAIIGAWILISLGWSMLKKTQSAK